MEQDRQLFIEEKEDCYLVKLIDDRGYANSVKYPKSEIGLKNMYEFFNIYLRKLNINGVNKAYTFNHSGDPVALFNNSTKKIQFNMNSRTFKMFNNVMLENYIASRELFFRNTDINEIRISALPTVSKFEMTDGVINLVLNADYNMNISKSEREFIRELIDYKCGNSKLDIEFIKEEKGFNRMCVITCGDFRMIMPQGYTYSTIVGVVNDHNDDIDESRKRR